MRPASSRLCRAEGDGRKSGLTLDVTVPAGGHSRDLYGGRLFIEALSETPILAHYCKPYRPQTNCKTERSNRTLLDEWAYVRPYWRASDWSRALGALTPSPRPRAHRHRRRTGVSRHQAPADVHVGNPDLGVVRPKVASSDGPSVPWLCRIWP